MSLWSRNTRSSKTQRKGSPWKPKAEHCNVVWGRGTMEVWKNLRREARGRKKSGKSSEGFKECVLPKEGQGKGF